MTDGLIRHSISTSGEPSGPANKNVPISRPRTFSSSSFTAGHDSWLGASPESGRRLEGYDNWQALQVTLEHEEEAQEEETEGERPGQPVSAHEEIAESYQHQNIAGVPSPERLSRKESYPCLPMLSLPAIWKTALNAYFRNFWPPSPVATTVFKCSLAYFLASLFTFVPALSSLLSTKAIIDDDGRVIRQPAELGHMVATMLVFFNAGKSLGNMLLSNQYCFALVSIAIVASLLSMATFSFLDRFSPTLGLEWDFVTGAGDWVVCFCWIGGTMGLIAWAKVWVRSLHFNGGCSMAAILLYNVVLRDGSIPKMIEILKTIAIGVCIANLVNIAIFPSSSASTLQKSISNSLESFAALLDLLTSTFLLEKPIVKENRVSLNDAIKHHAATFMELKADLKEAKRERIFDARIRGKKLHLYEAAVTSLGRLAQHLSGLRSCERLQENLISASHGEGIRWEKGPDGRPVLNVVPLEIAEGTVPDREVAASLQMLVEFRNMAGTQMDTLNAKCDDALEAAQALSQHSHANINLLQIRSNLADALHQFKSSASDAITKVYVGHEVDAPSLKESLEGSSVHSGHEAMGGPNETVFLIYFFLFTFEEFAREMLFLLDTMGEIVTSRSVSAWDQIKSHAFRGRKNVKKRELLYTQLLNIVPIGPSKLQAPLHPVNSQDSTRQLTARIQPPRTKFERLLRAWGAFEERLELPDMRYAIKTGLGGALLAIFAYLPSTREYFLHYRGEWAMVAYLSAMSQTVGQTNYISLARIFGTLVGGCVAVIFSELFPENHIVLPIVGWVFSLVCYYVITQMPDYFDAGRFTLLTYNLSCLFAYNSRNHNDVTVELIALERAMSVTVGIIWAGIVSRYWWPFTARRELRMGLSDFCLDLSYLYSKLVTTYSTGAEENPVESCMYDGEGGSGFSGETTPLLPTSSSIRLTHLNQSVRQFMSMELHLQSQLGSLRELLAHTKNEPRLKGPFAYDFYHEVLLSCERVLDHLHSMRCVTTRDEWDDYMRQSFVMPVNAERKEMAGSVILYFYTLSAGLRLRSPMPPYLPAAEQGRQKLVTAIRALDVVQRRSIKTLGSSRHLLFFAYALAMREVIVELEHLGTMMQDAFGVIPHGTAADFEALFKNPSSDQGGDGGIEASPV